MNAVIIIGKESEIDKCMQWAQMRKVEDEEGWQNEVEYYWKARLWDSRALIWLPEKLE